MNIDFPAFPSSTSRRSRTEAETIMPAPAGLAVPPDRLAATFRRRETGASIPEVRPEVVERGRRLLAEANYPSVVVATEIARRLVCFPEGEANFTD